MDDREFTKFYKKSHRQLLNYVLKQVNRYEDAEDIVQTVFMNFLSFYDDQANIEKRTYLFTLVNNELKDYWKSSLRSEKVLDFNSRILQNVIKDPSVNIENDYIKDEEALTDIVNEELEHLPALYRDILKKYYYEGKTQEEIANECSQQWVSESLLKGRKALKVRLKKRGIK